MRLIDRLMEEMFLLLLLSFLLLLRYLGLCREANKVQAFGGNSTEVFGMQTFHKVVLKIALSCISRYHTNFCKFTKKPKQNWLFFDLDLEPTVFPISF